MHVFNFFSFGGGRGAPRLIHRGVPNSNIVALVGHGWGGGPDEGGPCEDVEMDSSRRLSLIMIAAPSGVEVGAAVGGRAG